MGDFPGGTTVTRTSEAAEEFEELSAEELLAQAVERFHPELYTACSFQKESSVLIHMLLEVEPKARFFTLDTGVLFPETYEVWQALEGRYGIQIDSYRGISLARQASLHGDHLWARDPDECCGLRKVTPLGHALSGVSAWVAGLRREQSPQREHTPKVEFDERFEIWKFNPLADWTEEQVWDYLRRHEIPYNVLHDRGFGSIGCTHCTRPGEGREGRWAGREKTECGLHGAIGARADTAQPANGEYESQ